MQKYRPKFDRPGSVNYAGTMGAPTGSTRIARPAPSNLQGNFKQILIVVGCVFLTNILSNTFFNPSMKGDFASVPEGKMLAPEQELYLMDKASLFVGDIENFERKVREIASQLNIAPEWLMAVMYSESKFDASVKNYKGSGATGLIQFMPAAASELNVSLKRLGMMTHQQQMEYVFMYLQNVRDRYGEFQSLTDLYLAILYPKAINQDYCYTLYAKPSQSYVQNSGLDENKDGRVTISDIDRRMQRLYPTAYITQK